MHDYKIFYSQKESFKIMLSDGVSNELSTTSHTDFNTSNENYSKNAARMAWLLASCKLTLFMEARGAGLFLDGDVVHKLVKHVCQPFRSYSYIYTTYHHHTELVSPRGKYSCFASRESRI